VLRIFLIKPSAGLPKLVYPFNSLISLVTKSNQNQNKTIYSPKVFCFRTELSTIKNWDNFRTHFQAVGKRKRGRPKKVVPEEILKNKKKLRYAAYSY
jgi:hypothetical protein